MNAKILFVEDEHDLSLIVSDTLRQQGFDVVVAYDGIQGLAYFNACDPDIVVADVMMPRLDGFAMAKEIRRQSASVPIIFLTAKSTVDDVEAGFDVGANDYLKKPFELRELLVRVKALLRNVAKQADTPKVYNIGSYHFDVTNQILTFQRNETTLSHFESLVLEKLAENIGHTVNASELMIAVWQRDDPCNRNSLHGYIHKLRRVLRHDDRINIVNQRGFGYMLSVKNQDMR